MSLKMHGNELVVIALIVLATAAWTFKVMRPLASAPAHGAGVASAPAHLDISEVLLTSDAEHSTKTDAGKVSYDFGTVGTSRLTQHRFRVTNRRPAPVVIEQLLPSCPCVSAALRPAPADTQAADATPTDLAAPALSPPLTLAPGQSVLVDVTLRPMDRGHITKYLWVCIQGQQSPAASLGMTGTIQETGAAGAMP